MKIVYVRSYFSHFKTLYDYLEEAFTRAGHEVHPFDYRAYGVPAMVRSHSRFMEDIGLYKVNRDFTRLMDSVKPDMLFLMHGFTIQPETILEMRRKHRMLTVQWLCDYPRDYDAACRNAALFDHFFVSGTDAMKRLRLAGHNNVELLLFACDPHYHYPAELTDEERSRYASDICFVGSMYPGRERMFEKVSDFDIALWGPRWDEVLPGSPLKHLVRGGSLDAQEWVKAYAASKMVLNNISSFAPYVDNMINTRAFEALACKKLQLIDTRDDVLMSFTSGSDLVCYSSIEELRQLFIHYLNHPDEAGEIATSGYRKVMEHHTYDHRVRQIMDAVCT